MLSRQRLQISLLDLQSAPPAAQVASELLAVGSGVISTSSAPKFELHWLSCLLEAGHFAPVPAIEGFHAVSFEFFSGFALGMLYEKLNRRRFRIAQDQIVPDLPVDGSVLLRSMHGETNISDRRAR